MRQALVDEIRRTTDNELLGFVTADGPRWLALTVFHAAIGSAQDRSEAVRIVRERGLSSLAERWYWFSRAEGTWRIVLPQESRPGWVRLWVGYYPGPSTPLATVTADDLAAGDHLTLTLPADVAVETTP